MYLPGWESTLAYFSLQLFDGLTAWKSAIESMNLI